MNLAALTIAGGVLAVAASADIGSKNVLLDFYPQAEIHAKSVELCYTNSCEFYQSTLPLNPTAWDAVFLHQYFVIAPGYRENFRSKYQAHADALTNRYAPLCPRARRDSRPTCLIAVLSKRADLSYATVTYDEGNRCQVAGRLTDQSFQGRTVCRKERHAS